MESIIKQLIDAFDHKERVMIEANEHIASIIAPNILTPLFELIGVQHEQLFWDDFVLRSNKLTIKCTIVYDGSAAQTPFLEGLVGQLPPSNLGVERVIAFEIPLDVVTKSKQEVIDWLIATYPPKQQTEPQPLGEFNRDQLTKDQLRDLLFFSNTAKQ